MKFKKGDMVEIIPVPKFIDKINSIGSIGTVIREYENYDSIHGSFRRYIVELDHQKQIWAIEPSLKLIRPDEDDELEKDSNPLALGSWDKCPWSPYRNPAITLGVYKEMEKTRD